MSLQKLTLESVKDLDPGGALAVEKLLNRAALDCIDRPADQKARKVTLEFEITPVLEMDLSCNEAKVQIHAKAVFPAYTTNVRSLGVRQTREGGMFVFNEDSPGNVNQTTMLPEDEE